MDVTMEKKKGLENNKGEKSLDNTKGMNDCTRGRPSLTLAWQPSEAQRRGRNASRSIILENSKSHHKHFRHYCDLVPELTDQ
jgi:hypothetical protein